MKLSVVMPVYNESPTLKEIIERVMKVKMEKELIIVDDGSTDGSREILSKINDGHIQIYLHDKNRGKGAALNTAFKHVTGDIVVVQDADLEYYPEEYEKLIEPIMEGKADVVYGSRFWGKQRVFMFTHLIGNKLINLLVNVLYNMTFTDIETGFKAFRTDVLKKINFHAQGFDIEVEMTAKFCKNRLKIYEVPVSYAGRTYEEGKKIRWWDGLVALYKIIWYRFMD